MKFYQRKKWGMLSRAIGANIMLAQPWELWTVLRVTSLSIYWTYFEAKETAIRHFRKYDNNLFAPHPPEILHNHCFQFLLRLRIDRPKRNWQRCLWKTFFLVGWGDKTIIMVFSKVANNSRINLWTDVNDEWQFQACHVSLVVKCLISDKFVNINARRY